jgi:drug/metabolite transporter (DMT)-like permease
MTLAGVGWGVYSLAGRRARDPLAATAANFVLALPLGVAAVTLWPGAWDRLWATPSGVVLAMISGAITSGLGYALWYAVVPRLGAARSAVAQLTVPLLAAAGGLLLIGEVPGPAFLLASALVLGGVGWASKSAGAGTRTTSRP